MTEATKLRQKAEQRLASRTDKPAGKTPEAIQHTMHELQVHQIELEMQNEELRRTQTELHATHERYFDLYELAPMGYVTLNEAGRIMEGNLTAVALLGVSREALIGQAFSHYIFKADQDAYHQLRRQLVADATPSPASPTESHSVELRVLTRDEDPVWVDLEAVAARTDDGTLQMRIGICNISRRKRLELILAARMRLLIFSQTHSLAELLRATLDEAEVMTGSNIGFYHFVEADQTTLVLQAWSTNTIENMCQAEGVGRHYPVAEAGTWADCIRERRAVIHNDYAALPHRKGLPPGHATVLRQLALPVLRGERITAILGVGNKATVYTEEDVQTIAWLADVTWDLAEVKLAEERLGRLRDVQNFLARTSSGTKEQPFFNELARFLAQAAGVDHVCIDRLEGDGLHAQPVAVWSDGKFGTHTAYALEDTPSAAALGQQVCCFPADVCELFPRDAVLQDLQAEGYLGATLYNHDGHPTGLISMISRQVLKNREQVESILKLVVERAAGELERLQAEEELRISLREKEAMLQEIHHRVKNNLQIISSLLRLQAGQINNPAAQAALGDMQNRVRSMALIHEHLYRSENLAAVDLACYLKQLCQQLLRALVTGPGTIHLHLDLAPISLGIDQAIPMGLLVNELVSNALKHGFPQGRSGEVRVELQALADAPGWHLRVADNGVGLPADFSRDPSPSLGLQLVGNLAQQLGGHLTIGGGPGAVFEVEVRER